MRYPYSRLRAALWMSIPMTMLVGACDSSLFPGPDPTSDEVFVRTVANGASLDADGYLVTVDGGEPQPVPTVGSTRAFAPEALQAHEVELTDVARNCEVTGENPRTVVVTDPESVWIHFTVECTYVPREIAFTTSRDGNDELYAMAADGTGIVRLTAHEGAPDSDASWSPSGDRMAFVYFDAVFVMDAGGTNRRIIAGGDDPAWSPDGAWIAFVRMDSEYFWDWPLPTLWIADPDGPDRVRVSTGDAPEWEPAWSPDGRRLVFTSTRDGNSEIYVSDADGSNVSRITDDPAPDGEPAWSPDGVKLAFTTARDGNYEVYVVDADGSNLVNLTNDPAVDREPVWSPDGTQLAFTTDRDGNQEIYVMDADGSNLVNLTDHPGQDRDPAWSPVR